jgi:hypothetical protein
MEEERAVVAPLFRKEPARSFPRVVIEREKHGQRLRTTSVEDDPLPSSSLSPSPLSLVLPFFSFSPSFSRSTLVTHYTTSTHRRTACSAANSPLPPPPSSSYNKRPPTMRSITLLPLLLVTATIVSSSPHPDGTFAYHAHQAFAKNGTALRKRASTASTCPGNVVASYVPTWTAGAVQALDWDKTDLAFYFCAFSPFLPPRENAH